MRCKRTWQAKHIYKAQLTAADAEDRCLIDYIDVRDEKNYRSGYDSDESRNRKQKFYHTPILATPRPRGLLRCSLLAESVQQEKEC